MSPRRYQQLPRDYSNPGAVGAFLGDVVHARTNTVYGRLIRRCLPSWGNHDGILVCNGDQWSVAEALLSGGFQLTPWAEYAEAIGEGRTAVAFMRNPDATEAQQIRLAQRAVGLTQLGIKYDKLAITRILWNIVTRANKAGGKHWQWYCTEAVRDIYAEHGLDVWGGGLPTPYTTERRHQQRVLAVVGQMGEPRYLEGSSK